MCHLYGWVIPLLVAVAGGSSGREGNGVPESVSYIFTLQCGVVAYIYSSGFI